jgi:hypothetical protein
MEYHCCFTSANYDNPTTMTTSSYLNPPILSSSTFILASASTFLARSVATTVAGALFTKRSFLFNLFRFDFYLCNLMHFNINTFYIFLIEKDNIYTLFL